MDFLSIWLYDVASLLMLYICAYATFKHLVCCMLVNVEHFNFLNSLLNFAAGWKIW